MCSCLTSRNKTQTHVGGVLGVRRMVNTSGFIWGSGCKEFGFSSPFCSPAISRHPLKCPDVHWQLLAMTLLKTKGTRHCLFSCQLLYIHYYVYDTRAYLVVCNERILFHLAQEHHREWEMPLPCKFHLNGKFLIVIFIQFWWVNFAT